MAAATITQPRSSRRLFPTDSPDSTHQQLSLPSECELVANTFVVFKWQNRCCVLQANLTLYCWGRRRSGAIEHVLDKYGLTHSPQLHRINGKEVDDEQWRWLKQIFLVVHRLFDDKELGDSLGKVRWINIVECSLAYDVMRRECYHYHQNLYPKGKVLTSYLKRHGIEVEQWYEMSQLSSLDTDDPPPLTRPQTPPSNSSQGSRGESPSASSSGLGEREWLSDVHIANLMFLLLCRQLVLPVELRDLFQCVYPMTDQMFEQMLQRADPSSLLMHAKVGGGITLAFVNPNNNHWRLIVLDGLHQRVTLFDPLGAPLPYSLSRAIVDFVGSAYQVVDTQASLQAESWNCGVWAVYAALKYVTAVVQHVVGGFLTSPLCFQLREDGEDYSILDADSTTAQRQQNRAFANEVRLQYGMLLADARTSGRLLYVSDEDGVQAREDEEEQMIVLSHAPNSGQSMSTAPVVSTVVRAGIAASVVRHRRFIDRPLSELVWVDLTDGVGTVEVEEEEEMEQSYDDLCDQYIEFREDNINNSCAAALRYSLPANLQSDVLKEQINDFRAYRRQRFSLFRKGPLVEESTISSNISALLRFLGYLHYQQSSVVQGELLDMGVFALPTINVLVLSYVEWLEQRRGKKRQALDSDSFQPVTCATVANYLNGLIGIVKFQLRQDLPKRDALLDQLRNLRSQAESYSMTQKKFEKAHPEWCSWQELQVAREKCRAAFDERRTVEGDEVDKEYLLNLRELCLMCLFTICPPPRCSIIRLLEWDKTLVLLANQQWAVDLTDLSHVATRHKTHKKKGAMLLPLPRSMYKYLSQTRSIGAGPVFPAGLLSKRSSSSTATSPFLSPTSFTMLVKATFRKYTDRNKGPNPSLLRSIFTTWLYGLRYDTDDAFLQEIKSSSARWKAHSEQVASTVYNKELVYQQKEFAQLLLFCEAYSERYAYDRPVSIHTVEEKAGEVSARTRSSRKRRSREADVEGEQLTIPDELEVDMKEYVVEALVRIRVSNDCGKQVLVKWEGYRRQTWESYESMREQLPEMMDELVRQSEASSSDDQQEEASLRTFLLAYIAEHSIDPSYRWRPDQVNALDHAAWSHQPRIKETTDQLRRDIMALVSSL